MNTLSGVTSRWKSICSTSSFATVLGAVKVDLESIPLVLERTYAVSYQQHAAITVEEQIHWMRWIKDHKLHVRSLRISGDPDVITTAIGMIQACNTSALKEVCVCQDVMQTKRLSIEKFLDIQLSLQNAIANECPDLKALSIPLLRNRLTLGPRFCNQELYCSPKLRTLRLENFAVVEPRDSSDHLQVDRIINEGIGALGNQVQFSRPSRTAIASILQELEIRQARSRSQGVCPTVLSTIGMGSLDLEVWSRT